MFISVRRMVAEAQIEREPRLAELEALAGVDIETLGVQVKADTTGADQSKCESQKANASGDSQRPTSPGFLSDPAP
jgi:hypothetical protein